ncbi:interferon gamma [Gadus morhua]|uniref:Interferon gamma n=1 Tax=Gadus morhua TaxID=8049 RepID=C0JMI3_GADMO|nr:interferon gamma-like [Gadus morhua]ACN41957.1 interferon gamma [Gadus morhua]ACN41958.1 interferon gamma [Gadus morhua]
MALALGRSLSLFMLVCMSVCLSVCLPVATVPGKMLETIKTLSLQHPQKGQSSGSFFPRETLNKMDDGDKRVVLGKVLEVYDKLFDQMLSQPPTDSQSEEKKKEEAGIRYLQERVTLLRRTQYKKHLLLTSTLEQLGNIQINNSVVQSKALWDLPWLFDEASSLAERKRRSLRRRRAPRKSALRSHVLAKLRRAV